MPGGFGAAKNLSDIAFKGGQGVVNSDVSTIINTFHNAGKPIGAICISPALVAASLKGKHPTLTLGSENPMLKEFGASEQVCTAAQIALDDNNKIVTTPAYMCDERLANISTGISKLVSKVMELA
jgi:enhancing lycopene biosynthesis protein 2